MYNTNMSIEVSFKVGYDYQTRQIMPLGNMMTESWQPIKVSDGPFAFLDTPSDVVQHRLEIRKDLAEYIARAITREIMADMEKNDTINGYKKSEFGK